MPSPTERCTVTKLYDQSTQSNQFSCFRLGMQTLGGKMQNGQTDVAVARQKKKIKKVERRKRGGGGGRGGREKKISMVYTRSLLTKA